MKNSRIRIYYPHYPYPPTEGAHLVVYDQIRTLQALGAEVELCCWMENPAEIRRRKSERLTGYPPLQVKTIHLKVSSHNSRAGRVARSLFSSYASPELHYYPQLAEKPNFEPVDLALYNYSFAYPWLRKTNSSEKLRVVVSHNLESELSDQRAAHDLIFGLLHRLNAIKLRRHEHGLARLADEIWFISPEDRRNWRGSCRTRLVPPGFPGELHEQRSASYQRPAYPVVAFIGSLDFGPNHQSLRWILENVAPKLEHSNFKGELRIIGRGLSDDLFAIAGKYRFVRYLGFVEDLEGTLRDVSGLLVPHITGSGVRMKLLESIASGIPVLANQAAASRIDPSLKDDPLLFISDSAEEWTARLLSSDFLFLRGKNQRMPMPDSLRGTVNYKFIEDLITTVGTRKVD